MENTLRGITEEQQNDCRAALHNFVDRHEISDWEMTVRIEEKAPGKFSLKIELTPPADAGLEPLRVEEIAVADASLNVAAEVDKMLEQAYQARLEESKTS
jgi:hypothetical protein